MMRKIGLLLVVLAAVGLGFWLGGMRAAHSGPTPATPVASGPDEKNEPQGPVPVVAGVVEQKDVPIYLTGIGTVTALSTVQIKPREDGQLTEVRFREGQDVKVGEVLAIIDQRPYTAALKQAQANLARDQSLLANANLDLDRDVKLKEFASRQSVDTQKSMVAQYTAAMASDQAQIDLAKTNLDYTTITSPIDGRTGIRSVDPGNIVHAGDATAIVTVTQLQPIAVVFTLPADQLGTVTHAMAGGGPLKVLAFAKDNRTQLAEGALQLVDNMIDTTTGTMKLKASFANQDHALWPGQFVNARLLLETRHDGMVVASTALQRGPEGTYTWVIGADGSVAMRAITVGQIQDGQALVSAGLKPGEEIVVDGQYKLQAGSKVTKVAAPAQKPGKPGAA